MPHWKPSSSECVLPLLKPSGGKRPNKYPFGGQRTLGAERAHPSLCHGGKVSSHKPLASKEP